jgi:transcriptional regulator with XRE-family HTH domain
MTARKIVAQLLGTKLKGYRLKRGFSQERLARKMGMSREAIRLAESGEGFPEWETIEKMADALGVTIWDLLPTKSDAKAAGFRPAPWRAGAAA